VALADGRLIKSRMFDADSYPVALLGGRLLLQQGRRQAMEGRSSHVGFDLACWAIPLGHIT